MTALTTPAAVVDRDRFGRPYIIPPGQAAATKKKAYTRCTTLVSAIEDRYHLERWKMRMVATGLTLRDDLALAAAAAADDKRALDRICNDAIEAAKGTAAATTGTALHSFAEQLDRSQIELSDVPEAARPDMDAYLSATAGIEWDAIEQMVVQDPLETAGTPDRIGTINGQRYIVDLKTGRVDYGALKIAMQLAVYAQSRSYDPQTGDRDPLDVDTDRALVIHLPAGKAECRLLWVDIATGWRAVRTAKDVRGWRRQDKPALFTDADLTGDDDPVAAAIYNAATVPALEQVWRDNQTTWTEVHTDLAATRRQELAANTAA